MVDPRSYRELERPLFPWYIPDLCFPLCKEAGGDAHGTNCSFLWSEGSCRPTDVLFSPTFLELNAEPRSKIFTAMSNFLQSPRAVPPNSAHLTFLFCGVNTATDSQAMAHMAGFAFGQRMGLLQGTTVSPNFSLFCPLVGSRLSGGSAMP